jgi:hypothetical protein
MPIKFLNDVAVDSSVLYVDTINDRVGIGETDPDYKLHIDAPSGGFLKITESGADRLTLDSNNELVLTSPSNWGGYFKVGKNVGPYEVAIELGEGRTANGISRIDLIGDTTYADYGFRIIRNIDGANTTSQLVHRGTGNFELISIDSGDIILNPNNGNVGIGTTSPQVTLDVAGSSTNGKSLQVRSGDISTGTDSAQIIFSYGGNPFNSNGYAHNIRTRHNSATASTNAIDFYIWTPSDSANVLGSNRVMTIDGAGNVGIGTASPSTPLEIVNPTNTLLYLNSSTANVYLRLDDANSTNGNFIGATTDDMHFWTNNAERMRISNSGNVGIGTTNPISLGTDITTLNIQGSSGGGLRFGTTGGVESGVYTISSGTYIGSISNVPLYLTTNNSTKATILANGNVGIGTTSPGETLTLQTQATGLGSEGVFIKNPFAGTSPIVNSKSPFLSLATSTGSGYTSTIYMGRNATAADQESKIEWSNANNGLSIYVKGTGTYREHARFGNLSSGTPRTYFGGTVGIGTTSPAYLLDVNEDDNVLAFRVTGGGGGAPIASFVRDVGATGSQVNINAQSNFPQIQFTNTGNTFSIGGDTSGNFKISDSGGIGTNDRITISNTGNVGIGTTGPQSKLQVNGGVQLANDTATASASKVGTLKYYTSGNNSYVDMCMQTGATTYAWVNIVQNSW